MKIGKVNVVAVVVAVVASMVVGFLWFGPLFGGAWMNELGKTEDDFEPSAVPFVFAILGAILLALIVNALLNLSGDKGAVAGAKWGFNLWLFAVFPAMLTTDAFSGNSLTLSLIESGELLVYHLVVGAIIGALPPKS